MHLKDMRKNALIASLAVAALATAAIATAADARPRQIKARAAAAPSVSPMAIDHRYDLTNSDGGAVVQSSHTATRRAAASAAFAFGSSALVAEARRYVGTNPTGMSALWCARFMNMVLERAGRAGTGSNMASSFASHGRRVSGPQIGAIAVMSRGRRGGHVGVVSGIDPNGNPIIISGNHNKRVAEAVYPRGRVYAYVMPN